MKHRGLREGKTKTNIKDLSNIPNKKRCLPPPPPIPIEEQKDKL